MNLVDIQNTFFRVGEVQSIAQQAAYQAELAQKALSIELRKRSLEKPSQVQRMEGGAAVNGEASRMDSSEAHLTGVPAQVMRGNKGKRNESAAGPARRIDLIA